MTTKLKSYSPWLELKTKMHRKKTIDEGASEVPSSVFGKTMKRTKLLTQSNPIHGWIHRALITGTSELFNTVIVTEMKDYWRSLTGTHVRYNPEMIRDTNSCKGQQIGNLVHSYIQLCPWYGATLLTRRHPAFRWCNLAPSSPVDILVRPGGSGNAKHRCKKRSIKNKKTFKNVE